MKSTLDTLGLLHMCWGALLALGALFVVGIQVLAALGFFVIGAVAAGGHDGGDGAGVMAVVGIFQGLLGLFLGIIFAGLAGVHFFAGRGLRAGRQSAYVLSMVSAVLMGFSFPLGTALAIWTFVTVSKPEARALLTA